MNRPPSPRRQVIKALVSLLLAAATIAFGLWHTGPRGSSVTSAPEGTEALTSREREAAFDEILSPIFETNRSRNQESLTRLQQNLRAQFDVYRNRVPTFTKDITSLGNKSKITLEALKQLVSDDKAAVQRHVTEKFEMHIVNADGMQRDLEGILDGFRQEVLANRNLMLSEIEAAVESDPRTKRLQIKLPDHFVEDIESRIAETSKQAGTDAVVMNGVAFLTAAAAEEATRMLVTVVLTRVASSMASSMATTTAVAGGTTAAGGAGGGTVGALGGPPGVVIGIGVGILVGVIVDYVMTEKMEVKLEQECRNFIDDTEHRLISSPDGLAETISKALVTIEEAEASSIRQQLIDLP